MQVAPSRRGAPRFSPPAWNAVIHRETLFPADVPHLMHHNKSTRLKKTGSSNSPRNTCNDKVRSSTFVRLPRAGKHGGEEQSRGQRVHHLLPQQSYNGESSGAVISGEPSQQEAARAHDGREDVLGGLQVYRSCMCLPFMTQRPHLSSSRL